MFRWIDTMFRWIIVTPSEEASKTDAERMARNRNLLGAIALLLMGIGLVVAACAAWPNWSRADMLGLTFLLVGALSGFLFGVPKSLSQSSEPANTTDSEGQNSQLHANTNLEKISDWLTAIIVGVGLVELKQIPGGLHQLAMYMAPMLGGTSADEGVALNITLYFVTLGFLWGYLALRLFASPVISQADLSLLRVAKQMIQAKGLAAKESDSATAAALDTAATTSNIPQHAKFPR